MRVKQTARKSTGSHMMPSSSSSSSSRHGSNDPVRTRMQHLLHTKRKSATPSQGRRVESVSGIGKGKRISYSDYHAPVKKRPRAKSGTLALKEIKKLQQGHELLMPRAPFHRLVREITQQVLEANHPEGDGSMRYQTAALEALQEAAESYLTNLFEDSYMCTIHSKRVTLFVADILLCQRLQRRIGLHR